MKIQAERGDLIDWLLEADETILKKIKEIRDKSLISIAPPKKMTMDEYQARIDESERAIKEGRVITAKEMDEKINSW